MKYFDDFMKNLKEIYAKELESCQEAGDVMAEDSAERREWFLMSFHEDIDSAFKSMKLDK